MTTTTYSSTPRTCPTRVVLASVALWLCVSHLASAQTLPFDLLTDAQLVGAIKLDKTSPHEVLLFQHRGWKHVLFLVTWRTDRHGVSGHEPGPGLCIEPGFTLSLWPESLLITDFDGDGRQEIIATGGGQITRVSEFSREMCGERRAFPTP